MVNKPSEKAKLVYRIFNDCTKKYNADIYYDKNTDTYSAELLDKDYCPTMFSSLGENGFIEGDRPYPDSDVILNWLENRVIPPNRDWIKHLLEIHGLSEYNWKEMIKLNHGRTVEDRYSVEVIE